MNNGIKLWPTTKTAGKLPIGVRQWAFHDERAEKSKESGLSDILERLLIGRQLREVNEALSHDHHCILSWQTTRQQINDALRNTTQETEVCKD